MKSKGLLTRREFLKASTAVLAGTGSVGLGLDFFSRPGPALAEDTVSSGLALEPAPVIRILRHLGFVKGDEEIWIANTKAWEAETGGKVITDFVPWTDIRSKAAMESVLGAGHDIVIGFFDDPQLYPRKLLDVTSVAEYLGKKYGGWYPVCEVYGCEPLTRRWIALPVSGVGHCINYRKSWLNEAGFEKIPTDIGGFLKCCKSLKAKGHPTGFTLGHAVGDADCWTHWWLWAFGAKAVETDGRTIVINGRETIQALETARELADTMIAGVEKWEDPHNNQAFLAGEISITANAMSILCAARSNYPDLDKDLDTAVFSVGPVGRPTELSLMSMAFIFKHTTTPNAAKHFLQFMLEAPQYSKWVSGTTGYYSPTLRDYSRLQVWEDDSRITIFRDCLERTLWNGYSGPLGPASAAAMAEYVIVDMFADACTGRKTPQAAALSAEQKLARLYASS